jgi:hypothetical protein
MYGRGRSFAGIPFLSLAWFFWHCRKKLFARVFGLGDGIAQLPSYLYGGREREINENGGRE